jgi:iron-sulfur cluster repair protein YtfE (RIC family)
MVDTVRSLSAERAFAGIEHRDLLPGLERVRTLASRVGRRAAPEVAHDLHEVVRWFHALVEPHLAWEEAWLYPELDRLTGSPWATRLARFEHARIRELASRLDADGERAVHEPTPDEAARSVRDLLALETALRLHMEAEEGVLFPILDEVAASGATTQS